MNEQPPTDAAIKVELRRLGAWKREKLPDTPSGRSLARNLKVSPTTVSEWLRGNRVPQSCHVLLALISFIRVEAQRRSLLETAVGDGDGQPVAQLLDNQRWRDLYEKDSLRRSQLGSAAAEGWQARAFLEAQTHRTPRSVERDPRHPVRSWTARQLGVHAAISGGPALAPDEDFVLPTFVPRPHDRALRELLSAAVEHGESKLVLVRGDSCTGKTRSAFEAVREVVPDWDLVRFGEAESLQAALELNNIRPRTVLWLDTGHHYLYGAIGESIAAALRNLLDQGDDLVFILLTLWREDDHILTSAPRPGQEDTHLQARSLLAQANRIIVPPDFSNEMNAVRQISTSDTSLSQALAADTSAITQTLAAGPALLDHYNNPAGEQGFHGRALITAAIDARRLGVNGPLPLEFLRVAAPGYLTDSQRAEADPESWFTAALAYAELPIKRVVSALHPLPSAAGMGPAPGVVGLADYLEQHERSVRRLICPPATFWTAARDHLATPDVRRLARAAAARGRFRYAASLYCSVADHGDPTVLGLVGQIREAVGEIADAERLYQRAANDGYPVAMIRLALLYEKAGNGSSAELLYAHASRAGNIGATMRLAQLRERQRDLADAERLYTQAAASGNSRAMIRLGRIREKQDDANGAEKWYRKAMHAGGADIILRMAQKWERGGDWTSAERLYSLAADCGAAYASVLWARLRHRKGDLAGAEHLYRQAADAGSTGALVHLGQMNEKTEDWSTAEQLYQQAADGGNVGALLHLARLRRKNGDRAGSETFCRKAADAGEPQGLILLARACEKRGDRAGAESMYKEAAERGGATALFRVARLRNRDGDEASAALLYQQAADTGNTAALVRLGRLMERAGDRTRAEHMFRQACDGGDSNGVTEFMRVRMNSDQPLTYGLEPDGTPSAPW
ncbi:tetratricopeptide repeat protein [Streptomyces avermitilis]|uniref:tetratricopeptide repeat protein n=1 Tax=Streptomyces avermitilis TaxID=33903 RepID=UPI0033C66984